MVGKGRRGDLYQSYMRPVTLAGLPEKESIQRSQARKNDIFKSIGILKTRLFRSFSGFSSEPCDLLNTWKLKLNPRLADNFEVFTDWI